MLSTVPTLIPLTQCFICGHEHLRSVNRERFDTHCLSSAELRAYDQKKFWLNRCLQCGFMQPEGMPEEKAYFDWLYSHDYMSREQMEAEYASPFKDLIFQTILRNLSQRLPREQRTLIDVGTNLGRMLTLAAQLGWTAEGIELSSHLSEFAAKQTGLPVHSLDAAQLAQTNRYYNAVVLTDVLEHIPNPVEILTDLRQLLLPGGWIAVKVPCGANQLRKQQIRQALRITSHAEIAVNLIHINHFNAKNLTLALQRAGFESISIQIGAPELPSTQGTPNAILSRLFRTSVYRAGQLLPGGVHTPLALNLQAYARRAA